MGESLSNVNVDEYLGLDRIRNSDAPVNLNGFSQ